MVEQPVSVDSLLKMAKNVSVHVLVGLTFYWNELVNDTQATEEQFQHHLSF
jgi:hypothetical protein